MLFRSILSVLDSVGGHKKRAAEILQINPSTLYRKLIRYGVAQPGAEGEEGAFDEASVGEAADGEASGGEAQASAALAVEEALALVAPASGTDSGRD